MKVQQGDYGSYKVSLNRHTVEVSIQGVVDMELALRLMLDIKILLQDAKLSHWASLLDLSEWGLHPPEIVDFIREFQTWAEENGQLAEAAVVHESVLKIMARDRLVSGTRKFVHQEYFVHRAQAIEWLQALSLFDES